MAVHASAIQTKPALQCTYSSNVPFSAFMSLVGSSPFDLSVKCICQLLQEQANEVSWGSVSRSSVKLIKRYCSEQKRASMPILSSYSS